jgi:hypothetical protein
MSTQFGNTQIVSTQISRAGKTVYWTTTGIVCAVMVFSAINFSLRHPLGPAMYQSQGAFAHLGLPNWFKVELVVAKILGVLALLAPNAPGKIRDFAYFGFAITLISASIAHFSSGDGVMFIVDPMVFLALLAVSYSYAARIRGNDAEAALSAGSPLSASGG